MTSPLDLGGLTIRDLAKRVWEEISDDNVWDGAAQLGYYFMLAMFPLLIFLLSIVAMLPTQDVVGPFMQTLRSVMPGQAATLINTEVERIVNSSGGGLLTIGMLGTIWAASSGVASLMGTLNRAYEAKETRGYLKLRLMAISLTFALAALLITGSVLLVMGDNIAAWGAGMLGLAWAGKLAGVVVNYALGLGILFVALEVVYYFGPNVRHQRWKWLSPGSIFGVALFVVASVGFSLYVRLNDSYSVTYGSIGAVIVLMLWLYLLGLSIILGAEINSEIEKAAEARGEQVAEPVVPAEPKDPGTRTSSADESAEKPADEAPKEVATDPEPTPKPPEPPKPTGLAAVSADDGASAERLALRDLLKALEQGNARVRAAAAAAIGNTRTDTPEALSALTAHLSDDDERVRDAAARAIELVRRAA